MYVRELGAIGNAPVLLLHGQLFDGGVFDALATALSRSRRTLAPDLPGHGRTPLVVPWTFDGVRAAIEAELAARGTTTIDVVGYSLGTYHALALALAGRFSFRKIYLLGAVAGMDEDGREAFARYARALREGTIDIAKTFMDMAAPRSWAALHPREIEQVTALARAASPRTLVAELDAVSEMPDLRPRLCTLRSELLVRVGSEDANTPVAWSEAIASAAPGARLEIAPGVGHLYLVQDLDATVASALAFMSA